MFLLDRFSNLSADLVVKRSNLEIVPREAYVGLKKLLELAEECKWALTGGAISLLATEPKAVELEVVFGTSLILLQVKGIHLDFEGTHPKVMLLDGIHAVNARGVAPPSETGTYQLESVS